LASSSKTLCRNFQSITFSPDKFQRKTIFLSFFLLKEKKIKADGGTDIGKVFAVQKKRNAGRIIELLRVLFLFGTSLKQIRNMPTK
jgi:hypothetical protein